MANITITEAVHVSITGADGEPADLDLKAGDNDVEQVVADLLISQGLATPKTSKASATKDVVGDSSTPTETPEAK
jgi:hypothetical protein